MALDGPRRPGLARAVPLRHGLLQQGLDCGTALVPPGRVDAGGDRSGQLPVDDLAAYGSNAYEFDGVEDRYLEALHALDREPGTHPRDALAFLARGDAAPAEPAEPPERVYDDAEDAVDDLGFDSDGLRVIE